jgi:DNA-binding NarL/FixJ family response regulator
MLLGGTLRAGADSGRWVVTARVIARGKTNPDIAVTLFLSSHTVKSHINRIFSKTGAVDRSGAVLYAKDHDLV